MHRTRLLAIALMILSWCLYGEAGRADRIGITINAVNSLLGEAQLDLSIKYGDFEFSLKPGLRFAYVLESGGWMAGRGVSVQPTLRHYFTPSLYLGLTLPAVLWLDPPHPLHDLAFVVRTGVAPVAGWRCALGPLLVAVELGAGIGAQHVFFESPEAYGIAGWLVLRGELAVGLAFRRKEPQTAR